MIQSGTNLGIKRIVTMYAHTNPAQTDWLRTLTYMQLNTPASLDSTREVLKTPNIAL